jgi:hypothetical protein
LKAWSRLGKKAEQTASKHRECADASAFRQSRHSRCGDGGSIQHLESGICISNGSYIKTVVTGYASPPAKKKA